MSPLPRWPAWPVIAFALLLLGGCSSMRNGGAPDPAFSVQDDLISLKASLSASASVAVYHAGSKTAGTRNAFVDARVALANLAYIQFISDLTADKQQIDTASEMLVPGLNLLGTTATGGDAPAGHMLAWPGVMLVTGSNTVVSVYREA